MLFYRICLVGTCLSIAAGCQTANPTASENTTFEKCTPDLQPVRTVADVEGTVHFDQQLKQYRLDAPQPNTVDAVDVGVVCGMLPTTYQVEGRKVVFSGAYKTYASAPGGYAFYHLELTKIQGKQAE